MPLLRPWKLFGFMSKFIFPAVAPIEDVSSVGKISLAHRQVQI